MPVLIRVCFKWVLFYLDAVFAILLLRRLKFQRRTLKRWALRSWENFHWYELIISRLTPVTFVFDFFNQLSVLLSLAVFEVIITVFFSGQLYWWLRKRNFGGKWIFSVPFVFQSVSFRIFLLFIFLLIERVNSSS